MGPVRDCDFSSVSRGDTSTYYRDEVVSTTVCVQIRLNQKCVDARRFTRLEDVSFGKIQGSTVLKKEGTSLTQNGEPIGLLFYFIIFKKRNWKKLLERRKLLIKCKSDITTETIAEINTVLENLTLEKFQKILQDNRSYVDGNEDFSMENYCLFLFWNFKTKEITLKPEWNSTLPILIIEPIELDEPYTTMMGDKRFYQTIQEQIVNLSDSFSQERLNKMISDTQVWYKEFLVDKEESEYFILDEYWNRIHFDDCDSICDGFFPFAFLPTKYITGFLESYIRGIIYETKGKPTVCTEHNNLVLKNEFQYLSDDLDKAVYSELVESMNHTWETCLVNLNISNETRVNFVETLVKGFIKNLPQSNTKYNIFKNLDIFLSREKIKNILKEQEGLFLNLMETLYKTFVEGKNNMEYFDTILPLFKEYQILIPEKFSSQVINVESHSIHILDKMVKKLRESNSSVIFKYQSTHTNFTLQQLTEKLSLLKLVKEEDNFPVTISDEVKQLLYLFKGREELLFTGEKELKFTVDSKLIPEISKDDVVNLITWLEKQ